ncbi:DUF4365 domain-containing protein [uncultured Sphingobacterium sp.]|jgi:hypothetical protein|uniref:DUF4365 domain-containing protein n=1 Tax=uncultured Sphingobacterium sp. TaxID=182688 RepID=UPI003749F03A
MSHNIALPKSSRQEELETISRNRLSLKFDPSLFELRSENQRDKGIDFIGEIKQNGVYTNFRFAIQLKSTESSKKLKDGSITYPIEVSNLNYLVNFGIPSYYILYDYPADQFYMESVGEVYRSFFDKYNSKKTPKTYKVKFRQALDHAKINMIFKEAFDFGSVQRNVGMHLRFNSNEGGKLKGIVIDGIQEVYSIDQNIAFIENYGYELLNQHAFSQIIEIEERSHPRDNASATFNMVCGIAYYHQHDLLKAINFLKLAYSELNSLHPEDQTMVTYTLIQAKYLLGIIGKDQFSKEIERIVENENAGSFLQFENLYNKCFEGNEFRAEQIKKYYDGVTKILDNNPQFADMRIVAYAHVLKAEAKLLLHELVGNYLTTIGRKVDAYRDLLIAEWSKLDEQYNHQLKELVKFAKENYNFLAVCNLLGEKIEWEFTKTYYFHSFSNWNKETLSINIDIRIEDRDFLLLLLNDLDPILDTYDKLQHRRNQFHCLVLRFEILHFLGMKHEAEDCLNLMRRLIEAYELNSLGKDIDKLTNGNTRSYLFMEKLVNQRATLDRIAKNEGIHEYLYKDISPEMNAHLGRKPKWSLAELLPLTLSRDSELKVPK